MSCTTKEEAYLDVYKELQQAGLITVLYYFSSGVKSHDAFIDDHCYSGHLVPNGDCITGKNQAINADG